MAGGLVERTAGEYQALIADLVKTLLEFAERNRITTEEYLRTLAFLTEVGRTDEMVLLGDTMHLSIAIDDRTHAQSTMAATTSKPLP
jgi:hypothetical protein